MLDAVLFDLDGTLTDPAVGIIGSFRHALAAVGHPAPGDVDLTWMIGPPLGHNFARYGLPEELHAPAVRAFRARHSEVGLFEATVIPGIENVLDSLVADGIPLGLATAKPVPQAHVTLDHFGLADRFAVVAGGNTYATGPSKADIVADALAQLGGPDPTRVAMVGDRRHDVAGGRAHGCLTVAVTWGYAETDEWAEIEPDHRVEDPAELLAVLRSLPAAT